MCMLRKLRGTLIMWMFFAGLVDPSAEARTLRFSGYEWEVKSGDRIGPGPCSWRDDNALVDINGQLHLKISRVGNKWYSSEIATKRRFGFGRYQFQVDGQIDKLDRNVVFGMFNYPTPDVGTDDTNELDIELAGGELPTGQISTSPSGPPRPISLIRARASSSSSAAGLHSVNPLAAFYPCWLEARHPVLNSLASELWNLRGGPSGTRLSDGKPGT